jgi:hypothetical protein
MRTQRLGGDMAHNILWQCKLSEMEEKILTQTMIQLVKAGKIKNKSQFMRYALFQLSSEVAGNFGEKIQGFHLKPRT